MRSAAKRKGRFNVSIESLPTGWHDKDEVLLHAAFQLLVNFVDLEEPGKIVDWSWDAPHRKAWKEIESLYDWWTKMRPRRKGRFDHIKSPKMKVIQENTKSQRYVPVNPKAYKKYAVILRRMQKEEDQWHSEDQKNLHRLIEIRPFLWT